MNESGNMSYGSINIDLNVIGTTTGIMVTSNEHSELYEKGFELTNEAKKDLALGKADYSRQCIDVASDILYAIVSKKRLKLLHKVLNKTKNPDYDGDGGFPELLALSTDDGTHEGIPMVVTLDEETTNSMICRAIDSITRPLIKNLAQHGENIIIKCNYIEDDNMLIIGILWEKENK